MLNLPTWYYHARVAELVDALDLGSSSRKGVGVRVPSLAPKKGVSNVSTNRSICFTARGKKTI